MSWLAKGDPHGCTIKVVDLNESFKSWEDDISHQSVPLRLISKERLIITPPPVQTKYVELPGKNGKIDMTEVLTGFPTYGNRTGQLVFIVDNADPGSNSAYDTKTWADKYEDLLSIFHGKEVELTLDDDPRYTYKGRISVDGFVQGSSWSQIAISYDFDPYKYDNTGKYTVTIENTGSSMDILVKKGATTVSTATSTNPFVLNTYLDAMPVIPESTIDRDNAATDPTSIHMINNSLGYNKTIVVSETSLIENYYGLQSFVMTKQASRRPNDKCSIQVSGGNSTVILSWTNGRL